MQRELTQLNYFDFGKNTHFFLISFRFDAISPADTRTLVRALVVDKKHFASVSKEQSQTLLTAGNGTPEAPLFQVWIASDSTALWAGWHVPIQKWRSWRAELIAELSESLMNFGIRPEFVGSLSSQYLIPVPRENIVPTIRDISALQPVIDFYKRFVPDELLKGANGFQVFTDSEGKTTLELGVGVPPNPDLENVQMTLRTHSLDDEKSLRDNFEAHASFGDEIVDNLHAHFLPLFVEDKEAAP